MKSLSTDKEGVPAQTFPKEERLTSKKHIEDLFSKGKSEFLFPFRILYAFGFNENQSLPKVLISVPKRNFKKAVDRNRIRRQIKEIYRKNKQAIFSEIDKTRIPAALGIVFIAKEKIAFEELQKKLISILLRLK